MSLFVLLFPLQINEEFKRITTVNLESTFMAKLDQYLPKNNVFGIFAGRSCKNEDPKHQEHAASGMNLCCGSLEKKGHPHCLHLSKKNAIFNSHNVSIRDLHQVCTYKWNQANRYRLRAEVTGDTLWLTVDSFIPTSVY